MLTLPVLVDLLLGPYAQAHQCLEEEVSDDVKRGLVDARLSAPLCAAIWQGIRKARPNEDETQLMDTLSKAMSKALRKNTPVPDRVLDKMAALFTAIDANVGRASLVAKQALESAQGKIVLDKSLAETGDFLAERLLPSRAS